MDPDTLQGVAAIIGSLATLIQALNLQSSEVITLTSEVLDQKSPNSNQV
ncbi:TPA: hypothetical protein ACMDU4_000150 [Vibrio parahaemolyticus]|nr:hypothetical protein [Vibrio parahaemolyticus]